MKALGFDLRSEAALTTVTSDVITGSAIEGESLDPAQVRLSVARHLGLDTGETGRRGDASILGLV